MPLFLCIYVFIVVFALFIPAFNQQYATSTGTEIPTSDRFHEQHVFAAIEVKVLEVKVLALESFANDSKGHMESVKEKIVANYIESLNEMKGVRMEMKADRIADRIALVAEMKADRIALVAEMKADRIASAAEMIPKIKSNRKAVVDESKNIVDKMDARFKEVAEERKADRIASAEEMKSLNFKILILISFDMACIGMFLAGVFAALRMIGDGLKKRGNENEKKGGWHNVARFFGELFKLS
jgi:hypothetical protein